MPDTMIQGLSVLVQLLELVGAAVLILGFILATKRWIQSIPRLGMRPAIHSYRQALGRSILIGLEILVAATIIKTAPPVNSRRRLLRKVFPAVEWSGVVSVVDD